MLSPTFHPHRGGAESLAEDLAGLFVERGHAVTVLTASGEADGKPETRRGARVLRVRYPRPHLPPLARPAVLRAGARMQEWHRRLLTEGAVDAVCVARIDESCRYLLALKRALGFRLTVYLHGGELRALQRERWAFRHVLRRALRAADAVVAVSENLHREAAIFEPGVAARLRLIPNGIDVAAVAAVAPAERARPYVLFAGRLERVKNPTLLVEAFARVAAALPALDLVLAGEGSQAPALADLVAARGLAGRVYLLGALEREPVYALMKSAECLVVPSLAEGHPLVVLEAWAAGTPVLASDVKGLRGLVEDAARFPLDDPAGLARLLIQTVGTSAAEGGTPPSRPAPRDPRTFDLRTLVDRHLATITGSD